MSGLVRPTDRQAELLTFIVLAVDAAGVPPTIREMCAALKISTNAVCDLLRWLECKGWIARDRGRRRGLRVLARPPTVPARAEPPPGPPPPPPRAPLTSRQAEVLRLYQRLWRERGYPPTIRAMAAALSVNHYAVVCLYRSIEAKGYIAGIGPARRRVLAVLHMPPDDVPARSA